MAPLIDAATDLQLPGQVVIVLGDEETVQHILFCGSVLKAEGKVKVALRASLYAGFQG